MDLITAGVSENKFYGDDYENTPFSDCSFPPSLPLTSSSLIQLIAEVMFCSLSLIGRLFPSPMVGGGLSLVCLPISPFSLILEFLVKLDSYALYLYITILR